MAQPQSKQADLEKRRLKADIYKAYLGLGQKTHSKQHLRQTVHLQGSRSREEVRTIAEISKINRRCGGVYS